MKTLVPLLCAALAMGAIGTQLRAEETVQKWLVKNPFDWPDYGGTPDIKVSKGVGLEPAELAELLNRLDSPSIFDRRDAILEIQNNARGSEPAFRTALWGRHGVKNAEMKSALRAAATRATSKDGLLEALIDMGPSHPEHGVGAVGALRILGLLKALDSLNTMAAYKVLIEFSPRHAGVFRRAIGRMLVAHGTDALPALIYSRGSEDSEIHMFCVKWIRDMGNPLLGEQVKIKNPRRLSQLLEAYASVNDLDAIDVTLSLTNHDSAIVREAARRCIAKYDKNAKWPIRRQYENTFSKEPPKDVDVWSWAKELFDHYDRERLRPMTEQFEKGLLACQKGEFAKMDTSFRAVLRPEPMFPRRHEMARCYLAMAIDQQEDDQIKQAVENFNRVARLAIPGSDVSKHAHAALIWLRAEKLRDEGTPDPALYQRILDLVPNHEQAEKRIGEYTKKRSKISNLITKTLLVSLCVFLAAMLVRNRIRS